MTKDDRWMDKTFDELRSRGAVCSDLFSNQLEEKIMSEFTSPPKRRVHRLGWTMAIIVLVCGGTAAAYAENIRDWVWGRLHVEANGDIRNEDGERVGKVLQADPKNMEMQIQGDIYRLELAGEGEFPDTPFSMSFEPSGSVDHQKTKEAIDPSKTSDARETGNNAMIPDQR